MRVSGGLLGAGLLALTVTVAWHVAGGLPGLLASWRAPAPPDAAAPARGNPAWGFLGGALAGVLVLVVHLALLARLDGVRGKPVPLGQLASGEPWLHAAYAVNLAAALLVHLLVVGYGLGARFWPGRAGRGWALLVLASLPLSVVGFADLVRTVYTGLAFLALFLLPWLWRPRPGA